MNVITATELAEYQSVTPEMAKVFAAVEKGATTVSEIVEATGVIKPRVRVALNTLEANGYLVAAKGDKPGQAALWSVAQAETGEDVEAELVAEADAAADEAEAPQVATEETAVLVDGEVQIAQVPVAPVAEAPVAELGINAKKRIVAQALLKAAGDLVDAWGEDAAHEGVTAQEAAELFAKWLQYTPGKEWDARLGDAPALKA